MGKIDLKEKLMYALLIAIALKTDALVLSAIILVAMVVLEYISTDCIKKEQDSKVLLFIFCFKPRVLFVQCLRQWLR